MSHFVRAVLSLFLAVLTSSVWAAAFRIDMTATYTDAGEVCAQPTAPGFTPAPGFGTCNPAPRVGDIYTATFAVRDADLLTPGSRSIPITDFYVNVLGNVWSQNPIPGTESCNFGAFNLFCGFLASLETPGDFTREPLLPAIVQGGTITGLWGTFGVQGVSDPPFVFFYELGGFNDPGLSPTSGPVFFALAGWRIYGTYAIQQIGQVPAAPTWALLMAGVIAAGLLGRRRRAHGFA